MNNNFSDLEISSLAHVLGNDFNVRRNRSGNITVEYLPEFLKCFRHDKKFWTLYLTKSGDYLWRRFCGYGYCYPLNAKNRKRVGPIQKTSYEGKTYYYYERDWDIHNCEFATYAEAVEYFVNYLNKYRNINIKYKKTIDVESAVNSLSKIFTKDYIESCTDSNYFDWLNWFDDNFPIHTVDERNKFAKQIDDKYRSYVNEFFGSIIDYNELNNIVSNLRIIRDKIDNVIKNNNYNSYNNVLVDISQSITQSGKSLQEIVHEIFQNISKEN